MSASVLLDLLDKGVFQALHGYVHEKRVVVKVCETVSVQ